MEIEYNNISVDIWPIGLIMIAFFLLIKIRQKRDRAEIVSLLAFYIYVLLAIREVFFPIAINGTFVDTMKTQSIRSFMNLVPFYFGQEHFYIERDIVDFAKNVLLTVPFGFGILFVSHLHPRDFIWLPFAIGFGIEIIQFVISLILGYPYRIVDINDAILNAFGVIVGYILFRLFSKIVVLAMPTKDFENVKWLNDIDEASMRK